MRIAYHINTTANYSQITNPPLEPVLSGAEAGDLEGAFNRYSYVINNPLKYTDPSGEIFGLAAAAIFAGFNYLQGVHANGGQWNPTKWGATNAAGDPNFIGFGFTTNGNGTNSYGFGFGSGALRTSTVYNSDYGKSVPGINWGVVDADRGSFSQRNLGVEGTSSRHFSDFGFQSAEISKYSSSSLSKSIGERNLQNAETYKGVSFLWGGRSREGLDCSGLICQSISTSYTNWTTKSGNPRGYMLIPTNQSPGQETNFVNSLNKGDVLVFSNSHAAFYAGDERLYHASSEGVRHTNDFRSYWLPDNYGTIDVYRPYNSIVDFFRSITNYK